MSYEGGYLLPRSLPIFGRRAEVGGHTVDLEDPLSDVTLGALNAVQDTPWAINTWMADIAAQVWDEGGRLAGMPAVYGEPMPDRLPDDVWAAMTREARAAHRAIMADIHTVNNRAESKRLYTIDCLTTTRQLRDRAAIWYPHFVDFRTRIYPASNRGPHPQASDFGKSLIHFARGRALGPTGLRWLAIRAANCYGQDKLPLAARVQWVADHLMEIEDCANNPLDGSRFWTDADEPWGFLATCRELSIAFGSDNPEAFLSHLPIPLDGSCNGLQHLAAMGGDVVGAEATNLLPSTQRNDIYETVAALVRRQVADDATTGNPEAIAWAGNVTRTTVKRAVMTTPYGVTPLGIRDQLISDGHVEHAARDRRGPAANYMRDCIVRAVGSTVVSAKEVMGWLQDCAKSLGRAGLPLRWTTPAGSLVQQAYRVETTRRINTLAGEFRISEPTKDGMLDARKAALAAAPNVIHSFDAAHLQMTVAKLHDLGVQDYSMIHDSYGVHAGLTDLMGATLRDVFAEIYTKDRMASLWADFEIGAGQVDLPPPPERGELDVSQVRDSEFFFA